MIPTFAFLTLAILSLWFGGKNVGRVRRFIWLVPFIAAVVAGLVSGIVVPIALLWIATFALATCTFGAGSTGRAARLVAAIAIIVLAGGLMAHQLPGFKNPLVISDRTFGPDAIPFRLHLNFDKTLVGLFILGFCHSRIVRLNEWRSMAARAWPVALGMIGLLLVLSFASGYVRFDPKFPPEAWLWMMVNLCYTCVAEEALFRGFIQAQLQRVWENVKYGKWLALIIASILFGLAHAAGGPAYVVLASIAGVGYGWAYQRTRRIEASILTHFALNATHFFLFTYPALQPTS